MESQEIVREQYGANSLQARVTDALRNAGLESGPLKWSDLVPLDQFHVRGLTASRELAESLHIQTGSEILDVGCGLGGPARFLAATYGCQVTGIDLSQPFVDIATMLTARCGMTKTVHYSQADALALPFHDMHFDDAWTQHVAMNIADRSRLYGEIHRVLKPGGRLAIYDVVAGDGRSLIFPVPWARRPELSFLLTHDAMKTVLGAAGFHEVSWADKTAASLAWFADLQTRLQTSPPLGLPVVMGPEFLEMAANLARNLHEGRVHLVQTILRRD
ncbi:MAG TPA: class I SAM-dependent methyltransferase [Pirellulales bacterium]|jgi:SAM-dependent methyltransferase